MTSPGRTSMPARIRASVPGKVILMGEHAAVYGGPALVAALGLRVIVDLELIEVAADSNAEVELDLESLNYRKRCSWQELLDYRDRKLDSWARFRDGRDTGFESVGSEDPGHVVKIGLGEVARDADVDSAALPPLAIRVRSGVPVGSGFGSSAAVAVGVVAAGLTLLGESASPDRVARLALEVERRQHGHPSGVDHLTVLHGGILSFSSDAGARPLRMADWVPSDLALFDTGAPAESTGDVVAAVRRRREGNPRAFDDDLRRMAVNVSRFENLLTASERNADAVGEVIRDFEIWLTTLGVVPEGPRRAIEKLAEIGAVAKISGAGSLSGERAGCLLVFRPKHLSSQVRRVLRDYCPVEGVIGAPGLRLEEMA